MSEMATEIYVDPFEEDEWDLYGNEKITTDEAFLPRSLAVEPQDPAATSSSLGVALGGHHSNNNKPSKPDPRPSPSPTAASSKAQKKNPDRPKRPLSAYNLFFQHQRQVLLEELPVRAAGKPKNSHGKMGFQEMAKLIGAQWRCIDDQTKAHFDALAAKEKERHTEAVKEYKAKIQALGSAAATKKASAKKCSGARRKDPLPWSKSIGPFQTDHFAAFNCPTHSSVSIVNNNMRTAPHYPSVPSRNDHRENTFTNSRRPSMVASQSQDTPRLLCPFPTKPQQQPQGHHHYHHDCHSPREEEALHLEPLDYRQGGLIPADLQTSSSSPLLAPVPPLAPPARIISRASSPSMSAAPLPLHHEQQTTYRMPPPFVPPRGIISTAALSSSSSAMCSTLSLHDNEEQPRFQYREYHNNNHDNHSLALFPLHQTTTTSHGNNAMTMMMPDQQYQHHGLEDEFGNNGVHDEYFQSYNSPLPPSEPQQDYYDHHHNDRMMTLM